MSELHKFKCDSCFRTVDSNYNGEHHLPPKNWFRLYDYNKGEVYKVDICEKCIPSNVIKKLKKEYYIVGDE